MPEISRFYGIINLVWVIKADYISDYRIKFTFNDGISGIIEFKKNLTYQFINLSKTRNILKPLN